MEVTNLTPTDEYNRRTFHEPPPRRDTIMVKHVPRPEDAKHFGHAPRPVPETDRNFRPRSIEF